jgi:CubicO group peptidase (beta-lactamase class C family)
VKHPSGGRKIDPDVGPDEVDPNEVGMDRAALDRAVALVAAHCGDRAAGPGAGRGAGRSTGRGVVARLCVMRHGKVVLDRGFGAPPDALFWLFSTSKPFVAMLVHLLVRRGLLDLDDPVAAHWPEFGRHGKEGITVRHVLTHRAGVPVAGRSVLHDAAVLGDWWRSVRLAERARPRWAAGTVPAYHILSFGFILGELVRRVTGRSPAVLLAEEMLAPLELSDIHLGLTDAELNRAVPLVADTAADHVRRVLFNRQAVRLAVVPAAGVSATARDLARWYHLLVAGNPVLDGEAVAAATERSTVDGEVDRFLGHEVRWGHGFQLGGPPGPRPFGSAAGPRTFGHNGSSTCNAWADPDRGLVVAYLTNLVLPRRRGRDHQCAVSDALLAACR